MIIDFNLKQLINLYNYNKFYTTNKGDDYIA